jgi:para-nitrobenzyl esterase
MGEDCLRLNVYAPAAAFAGGARVPVMLWIHGGSFRWGAGSWPDGEPFVLANQGVAVVTINYRLGRLGLFAHPALSASMPGEPLANYALMDQIAALRWVRDNIAAFGGDPARVTVFGQSAGSVSVTALMAAPDARGLFSGAIAQNGAAREGAIASCAARRTDRVARIRWAAHGGRLASPMTRQHPQNCTRCLLPTFLRIRRRSFRTR